MEADTRTVNLRGDEKTEGRGDEIIGMVIAAAVSYGAILIRYYSLIFITRRCCCK